MSRRCLGSVSRLEVSAREGVEAPFVLDDDVARLRLHGRVEVGVPAALGEELVAGASREDAKPCPQTSVMKKNSTCRRETTSSWRCALVCEKLRCGIRRHWGWGRGPPAGLDRPRAGGRYVEAGNGG